MKESSVLTIAVIAVIACSGDKAAPSGVRLANERAMVIEQPPPDGEALPEPFYPDGSPNTSVMAMAFAEWVEAKVVWDPYAPLGSITAGFSYFGSSGEISIYPQYKVNAAKEYTTPYDPTHTFGPTGSAIFSVRSEWQGLLSNTKCNARLSGFVDFRSWFLSGSLRWGDKWVTIKLREITGGPPCIPPTVVISPPGPVTVAAGTVKDFTSSASSPGTGEFATYRWSVDGANQGAAPSWSGAFSDGNHVLSLAITNTAGLSGSASVAITVPSPETEPPPPPPSGGVRTNIFKVYEVWCYFISHDGGKTWVNTWSCFLV